MTTQETPLTTLAHTIQLSVAPVFLLTALGTFLGVLSTRLGRIVDRARALGGRLASASAEQQDAYRAEFHLLARRRHLVNMAITSGVSAAVLVCASIFSLFLGSFLEANVSRVVAVLFVAAVLAFTAALGLFLREVLMAVAGVSLDI